MKLFYYTFVVFFFISFIGISSSIFAQEAEPQEIALGFYSTGDEKTDPKIPYNIIVSNISTTSFTINWLTKEATTGSVIFAKNTPELSKMTLDKRDKEGSEVKRFTHSVDIIDSSLSDKDIIHFKLVSNNFEITNAGKTFSFSPPAALESPPSPVSQEGKLTLDFTPSETNRDFLVLAQIDDSTWVSAVSAETLNWNLPLGGAFSKDFKSYANLTSGKLKINIFGESNSTGKSETDISNDPITVEVKKGAEEVKPTSAPTPTQIPTKAPTVIPTQKVELPTPTPILGLENLPTTGIEDYFSFIPGIIILAVGLWLISLKSSKVESYY